jgi:hypothetical protein
MGNLCATPVIVFVDVTRARCRVARVDADPASWERGPEESISSMVRIKQG